MEHKPECKETVVGAEAKQSVFDLSIGFLCTLVNFYLSDSKASVEYELIDRLMDNMYRY